MDGGLGGLGGPCPVCAGTGRVAAPRRRGPRSPLPYVGILVLTTVVVTYTLATLLWVAGEVLSAGTAGFFEAPPPFRRVVWSMLPFGLLGGVLTAGMMWARGAIRWRVRRHTGVSLSGGSLGRRRSAPRGAAGATICPLCAGTGRYVPETPPTPTLPGTDGS